MTAHLPLAEALAEAVEQINSRRALPEILENLVGTARVPCPASTTLASRSPDPMAAWTPSPRVTTSFGVSTSCSTTWARAPA